MTKKPKDKDSGLAVPRDNAEVVMAASRVTIQQSHHSGPLPAPEHLERYESVLPGLADRIMKMAEANSAHRLRMEGLVVEGNVRAQSRGQMFAFAIVLLGMAFSGWMVGNGYTAAGVTLILGEITALTVVFLGGRGKQARERQQKRQKLDSGLVGQPPGGVG